MHAIVADASRAIHAPDAAMVEVGEPHVPMRVEGDRRRMAQPAGVAGDPATWADAVERAAVVSHPVFAAVAARDPEQSRGRAETTGELAHAASPIHLADRPVAGVDEPDASVCAGSDRRDQYAVREPGSVPAQLPGRREVVESARRAHPNTIVPVRCER